jgi:transcriptional regulator with XRE-family HTH domain
MLTEEDATNMFNRMRNLTGWSASRIGRELGIKQQTIQAVTSGRIRVGVPRFLNTAGILGISVDDLIHTVRDPLYKVPQHEHDEAVNLLYRLTQCVEHQLIGDPDKELVNRSYDLLNRLDITKRRPRWEI